MRLVLILAAAASFVVTESLVVARGSDGADGISRQEPAQREQLTTVTSFTLTSTAFRNGHPIPPRFTCDGTNVSPTVSWSGAPRGTAVLALVVSDPDARGFTHWLVYNVSGSPRGGLPEAVSRSAANPRQSVNDFGRQGYGGPCPPAGLHHYRFTLYALDRALRLTGRPHVGALKAAMAGHVIGETSLVGTYQRY